MAKRLKDLFEITWDNLKSFDDAILPNEREIIKELEKKAKENGLKPCQYLKKDGQFFYYCTHGLKEKTNKELSPENPIYKKHVSLAEMQVNCRGSYKTCCVYKGELKRKNGYRVNL